MMRGTAPKAKAKASPKASPKAAARGTSPEAGPATAARRPGVPPAREFPPLPGLPPLPLEALNIGEEIGKGRFKHVNRGILKGSALNDGNEADRDIVVIRYAKGKPECTIELQVLSRCVLVPDAAEHIPKVWGAAEQGRDLVLVQERAGFGCLKSVVTDAKSHYSPAHGLRAATQISLGMKGLQFARVVHADLSCRNILVSQLGEDPDSIQVKVTDFGLSCVLKEGADHEIRKQPMATRWCAPQHCAFQKLSHKGDVWSTGTLIWEMFSGGNIPWVNWTKRTEVAAKLKELAEATPGSPEAFFDPVAEFPPQEGYPAEAHDGLISCLQVDEEARPTFADLAEHFEQVIRLEAQRAEELALHTARAREAEEAKNKKEVAEEIPQEEVAGFPGSSEHFEELLSKAETLVYDFCGSNNSLLLLPASIIFAAAWGAALDEGSGHAAGTRGTAPSSAVLSMLSQNFKGADKDAVARMMKEALHAMKQVNCKADLDKLTMQEIAKGARKCQRAFGMIHEERRQRSEAHRKERKRRRNDMKVPRSDLEELKRRAQVLQGQEDVEDFVLHGPLDMEEEG